MKFSVITPVLNGARFIGAAIASVKAQTDPDWEMIIVDAGSTDGTRKIAATAAETDPRIRLVFEPDRGMYDGLFKGIASAKGEWICWLNSDDLYTPWCFATVRKCIEETGANWLTGYPACWDSEGRLRYARPAGLYRRTLIKAGWHHDGLLGNLQQEAMFFSHALVSNLTEAEIEEIRCTRLAGDFIFWRRLAERTELATLPSVLGGFRRHGENISRTQADAYRQEIMATNPVTFPAPLASIMALAYRAASSWQMMRAAAAADQAMEDEA